MDNTHVIEKSKRRNTLCKITITNKPFTSGTDSCVVDIAQNVIYMCRSVNRFSREKLIELALAKFKEPYIYVGTGTVHKNVYVSRDGEYSHYIYNCNTVDPYDYELNILNIINTIHSDSTAKRVKFRATSKNIELDDKRFDTL